MREWFRAKEFQINNNFADCSMYRDILVGHSLGHIKCFINGIAPLSAHGVPPRASISISINFRSL